MEHSCNVNKAVMAEGWVSKGINNSWEIFKNNTVTATSRTTGYNNRNEIQKRE